VTGRLAPRSVAGIFADAAAEHPEKIFAFSPGEDLTYGALFDRAERLAAGLLAAGIQRGSRIGLLMANRPQFLVIYAAVARAGMVFVPLVTDSTVAELIKTIRQTEIDLLIADDARAAYIESALRDSGLGESGVGCRILGEAEMGQVTEAGNPKLLREVRSDDVVAFMITSGTTGRPKAIMHTNYVAWAQAEAVKERIGYTESDRLMVVLPFFHGNALVWSALTAAHARASIVIPPRFSASGYWHTVREHGCTHGNLLTGALNMLLAQPPSSIDNTHGMRTVMATITPGTHKVFSERFAVNIVTVWAFAEAPLGTMATPTFAYRPGLVGWPLGKNNTIAVLDTDGQELPAGEVGELAVKNDAAMTGYYGDPEATAEVMRAGWVFSGDLGYRDDEGLFYFVGRRKQIIRRSGENISPEEVEDCLNEHPGVVESAVFAVPDDIRGEEVKAVVVLDAGQRPTPDELAGWCAQRLTAFKIPRYIESRDAIPKTETQKVQRHLLAAEPDFKANTWDRQVGARA
jgi:crotonobetaine/carnitine-CoA ligase